MIKPFASNYYLHFKSTPGLDGCSNTTCWMVFSADIPAFGRTLTWHGRIFQVLHEDMVRKQWLPLHEMQPICSTGWSPASKVANTQLCFCARMWLTDSTERYNLKTSSNVSLKVPLINLTGFFHPHWNRDNETPLILANMEHLLSFQCVHLIGRCRRMKTSNTLLHNSQAIKNTLRWNNL